LSVGMARSRDVIAGRIDVCAGAGRQRCLEAEVGIEPA
jgi:hypothetical protein